MDMGMKSGKWMEFKHTALLFKIFGHKKVGKDVLCYSMDILFLFYRKDLVTLKRESVFL